MQSHALARNRRPLADDGGQRLADGGRRPDDGGQRPEDGGRRADDGGREAGVSSQTADSREQRTEDGGQTSGVSSQTADSREQRTEDGGQKVDVRDQTSEVRNERERGGRIAKMAEADWAPSLLIFLFDIVCWFSLYGVLSFLRHDAYYSSAFELAMIDLIQLVVIVQCLFIIGGYSSRTEVRSLAYTAEHILAMIAALAVSALAIYSAAAFDHVMRPSRAAVLFSFVIFTPISLLYRRALRSRVAKSSAGRAFLVIGAGPIASNFYEAYCSAPNQQRLEFVDLEKKRVGQTIAGPGSPLIEGDLASKLREASQRYSGIILAEGVEHIGRDLLEHLIRTQFQRTRVYTLESFYEAHWKYVPVHSVDPFWPLQTGFQLSRASPYHYVKRLFDIVASGALLIICFPIMVIIGVLIRLTNGWPVIFRQERVGRDEILFTIYKFRTMHHATKAADRTMGPPAYVETTAWQAGQRTTGPEHHASKEHGAGSGEPGAGSMEQGAGSEEQRAEGKVGEEAELADIYTRKNDPRVSRIGRWLRKLRLDELPQLWNVFTGELSLIGPRAEWVECANRYRKSIPFYHFRHLVKPGITGWAQVNYPYGESDEDAVEKLKYDLYYIRHYSLTLDAMIVLKTIYTMLFGKGR
jgi:exopolysaccharide biosynthesis polyprenyl glycosylphosphotransferase